LSGLEGRAVGRDGAAFAVLGLLDAWLPAHTDRNEFSTIDGEAVRRLGVAPFAAGATDTKGNLSKQRFAA
jgi:hypothetical protein